MKLVKADTAQAIDQEARSLWGLDPFALVEAAGRSCAEVLEQSYPDYINHPGIRISAAVGSGNNGTDALVLLRTLIFKDRLEPTRALVVSTKPEDKLRSPRSEALRALKSLGVPIMLWDGPGTTAENALESSDILIDGIVGTGISGALSHSARELADALVRIRKAESGKLLVSIDVPSGLFDAWEDTLPVVQADATLAVEPLKEALFSDGGRIAAGRLLPVGGIFPKQLLEAAPGSELVTFQERAKQIGKVALDAHKYHRGVVEIHAGSPGFLGAGYLAALGAQAAGAGLVRLILDSELIPLLNQNSPGIMVSPSTDTLELGRFKPDALLLGPGWGWSPQRDCIFQKALDLESQGLALVLDADALTPSASCRFSGHTILTPHPGEFAAMLSVLNSGKQTREDYLSSIRKDPLSLLKDTAKKLNAVMVLKGHVLRIAAPDGRLGIVDGCEPVLAMGGSGDVLAGLTAALAARSNRQELEWDPYTIALCSAALLVEAGKQGALKKGFCDPSDIAAEAGQLAAKAWLTR